MAYGEYILKTGGGISAWEALFGRYIYESRFASLSPILDIGPGRCWFTRQNPAAIVAVDSSPEIVEKYRVEGINIQLGSAYQVPFDDDHFAGVFSCWLLEHLDHPDIALKEAYRIMRPGAYACFIVPSVASLTKGFYDDFTHVRPFSPRSLEQLARLAGFGRFRTSSLFYSRGAGRLLRMSRPNAAYALLSFYDKHGRRFGLRNTTQLVLEVRK